MRRIDAEHCGALADSRRQKKDLLVELALLEAIYVIQFCPNPPDGARFRSGDRADNEFRGAGQIRLVDDIFMAFRMHDDLDAGVLFLEVANVRRLEHLMHAAEALPE